MRNEARTLRQCKPPLPKHKVTQAVAINPWPPKSAIYQPLARILSTQPSPIYDECVVQFCIWRMLNSCPPLCEDQGQGFFFTVMKTTNTALKGSWDLVTRVIIRVTVLITPIKVLITLLTKSHDPPSMSEVEHKVAAMITNMAAGMTLHPQS